MNNPNDPTVGSSLLCVLLGPLAMICGVVLGFVGIPFVLAGIGVLLGGLVGLPGALKRHWEEV